MKTFPVLLAVCTLLLLFTCGCTSPAPQVPAPVTPVTTPVITTAAPTPVSYPEALKPGQQVPFGTEDKTGQATVYRAEAMQNYTWNSPSWNSPREQAASGPLLERRKDTILQIPTPAIPSSLYSSGHPAPGAAPCMPPHPTSAW